MAGAVLCVAAHPDDEDAGIVAYLARGLGIRTVCWSATRGEGGQNRIGPERDEALGILRTWESLTARTVDGGEALYGPFIDFGYCKRGEDALERWGRDAVVAEFVRAVRLTQPSVVLSRWSGAESDGHGHHQAIGMAVPEAFAAAGDPTAYPDLGVPPWRPLKLYHSLAGDWQPGETTAFGAPNADYDRAGFLRVDTDVYDPIAGRTYQEMAALAWNSHRSQAMGFVPDRGPFSSYYRLIRSLVAVRIARPASSTGSTRRSPASRTTRPACPTACGTCSPTPRSGPGARRTSSVLRHPGAPGSSCWTSRTCCAGEAKASGRRPSTSRYAGRCARCSTANCARSSRSPRSASG